MLSSNRIFDALEEVSPDLIVEMPLAQRAPQGEPVDMSATREPVAALGRLRLIELAKQRLQKLATELQAEALDCAIYPAGYRRPNSLSMSVSFSST
jgi:hypothetical protein